MHRRATPALSILLPTYNGEAYLSRQLDSILAQSWADFELIAVDDGSSDGSAAVLAGYARNDARIRILAGGGNVGQKMRLLQLAEAATAPLISIADQDDLWHPDRTLRLIEGLGSATLSLGRSELIDGDGRPIGGNLIEFFGPPPRPEDRLALLFRPCVSGHAMVVRREAVTDAAFRRALPYDWLIGLESVFSGGIAYVDNAIVYHRLHGGNQANASIRIEKAGVPQSLGRLYAAVQAPRRERFELTARLEHLAHSSVLEGSTRAMFAAANACCRNAWFMPGATRPPTSREAGKRLLTILAPLAGSNEDLFTAERHIKRLAAGPYAPAALAAAFRGRPIAGA